MNSLILAFLINASIEFKATDQFQEVTRAREAEVLTLPKARKLALARLKTARLIPPGGRVPLGSTYSTFTRLIFPRGESGRVFLVSRGRNGAVQYFVRKGERLKLILKYSLQDTEIRKSINEPFLSVSDILGGWNLQPRRSVTSFARTIFGKRQKLVIYEALREVECLTVYKADDTRGYFDHQVYDLNPVDSPDFYKQNDPGRYKFYDQHGLPTCIEEIPFLK